MFVDELHALYWLRQKQFFFFPINQVSVRCSYSRSLQSLEKWKIIHLSKVFVGLWNANEPSPESPENPSLQHRLWNCMCRLCSGFVDEFRDLWIIRIWTKKKINKSSKPMWLFVYILIAALGSVCLARMTEKTLFSMRTVEKIVQGFVYLSKAKAECFYNYV